MSTEETQEKSETITVRCTVSFKKEIDEARGDMDRAEFCRKAIKSYIEKPHETPKISHEITLDITELQMSVNVLQKEIELKDEIIRGKEAHINDLNIQLGYFHQYALPSPPEKEEKKQHWWQRKRKI